MTAWFPILHRRLRFRRVKLLVHSTETQQLMEAMQEQIDREHRWVHQLADEVERLRSVIVEVASHVPNCEALLSQSTLRAVSEARAATFGKAPNSHSPREESA